MVCGPEPRIIGFSEPRPAVLMPHPLREGASSDGQSKDDVDALSPQRASPRHSTLKEN
jgi:hypothetical protein